MRITGVEAHVCNARMRNWVFVRVVTDEPGLHGWGECYTQADRDRAIELHVQQLARYLERIRLDPARAGCRGILAAERFKPQAVTLADARGIRCAEVALDILRGELEPDLTLFAS